MNMNEFKEIIKKDLNKIGVDMEEKEHHIFFSAELCNRTPGDYFFADVKGFHYVPIDDRGNIQPETLYQNLDDCLFTLYWIITANLSIKYARIKQKPGEDWRRIMFPKRLELLRMLGEQYYARGRCVINEILENNPYNDALF